MCHVTMCCFKILMTDWLEHVDEWCNAVQQAVSLKWSHIFPSLTHQRKKEKKKRLVCYACVDLMDITRQSTPALRENAPRLELFPVERILKRRIQCIASYKQNCRDRNRLRLQSCHKDCVKTEACACSFTSSGLFRRNTRTQRCELDLGQRRWELSRGKEWCLRTTEREGV